ncbi:DUF2281 domain-containing protein [candidate division KSB1 bacterium]|nr:DUF2281 domain-containing protein [candidate division KSB1 bacterium]
MLIKYLESAMKKAQYEILHDNEGYFGKISRLQGVWANAETLENCREELQEVLEEWIIIGLNTKRNLGTAKGKIEIASDFDEPLEDFKEYME